MSKDKKRVQRTGPGVSLGDVVADSGLGGVRHTAVRRHVATCQAHHPYGTCVPGCETDAQLRARIVERLG